MLVGIGNCVHWLIILFMYTYLFYFIGNVNRWFVSFFTGELVTRQPLIASMRVVKKETLKLITCWVSRSSDPGMVQQQPLFLIPTRLLNIHSPTFSSVPIMCYLRFTEYLEPYPCSKLQPLPVYVWPSTIPVIHFLSPVLQIPMYK